MQTTEQGSEAMTGKRNVPKGAPKFAITDHKGVGITFANGVTISIQWGPYNYCADYWDFRVSDYNAPRESRYWVSPDAEIALFWADGAGEWLTKRAYADLNPGDGAHDDVLGALTPDEVARYIAWAADPARASLRSEVQP
jgi:hypothetical protein